jgi:hypothetical protein
MPETQYIVNTPARIFSSLSVKLTDVLGNTLDLNNSDWQALITVYSQDEKPHCNKRKKLSLD